jgi:hypothetical protein
MSSYLDRPALILGILATLSAIFGTYLPGAGYGDAPHPGVYMVLTGLWFGLVIGFAVWRWAGASMAAAVMGVLVTWIGWEVAVNVALQIDGPLLRGTQIPESVRPYAAGFIAGAVGALITWAAIAMHVPYIRRGSAGLRITGTGAVFGLLLPSTNHFDSGLVLLLPWQVAVAAMIGLTMVQERAARPPGTVPVATTG